MKLSLPLTSLLCAGMLLTSAASAAELTGTLKRIQHSGTMTLGYREASVPFSYLQADGTPTGYGFEVCKAVSEAVKKELNMPNLTIKYQAVTSANRIPLIQNGTVDIECGSTTNSKARQREAGFGINYFGVQVTAAVWKDSGINSIKDLNNKNVAVTSGTTAVALLKKFEKDNGIKIRYLMTKDFAESMQLGRQEARRRLRDRRRAARRPDFEPAQPAGLQDRRRLALRRTVRPDVRQGRPRLQGSG